MCPGPERAEGQGGQNMLRIGGTASPGHITVFRGLKTHFQQQGIALDWVLYADYDARAVSQRTLEGRTEQGQPLQDTLRVFWSSPGYSHCCFTAHRDLEAGLAQQITDAFLSLHYTDPLGKEVLDAEGCQAFVPGITTGWEALENALREPSR